jgi:pimeloyl-ACP methyl ester carboxylesterase
VTDVFYLHGFASSAKSTKAQYFADRLGAHGIALRCPDFNTPDFSSLTITRMLDQLIADCATASRVVLIGSSLGGALAILATARLGSRVDRLVLLAPAVAVNPRQHQWVPPDRLETWKRDGVLPFFHYAYGEERLLKFSFYQDAFEHDAAAVQFAQPALIFQGVRDVTVDPGEVERFANARPNADLVLLDDDHQLIRSLPDIWARTERFLGLSAA